MVHRFIPPNDQYDEYESNQLRAEGIETEQEGEIDVNSSEFQQELQEGDNDLEHNLQLDAEGLSGRHYNG